VARFVIVAGMQIELCKQYSPFSYNFQATKFPQRGCKFQLQSVLKINRKNIKVYNKTAKLTQLKRIVVA
jgi:hypothetical protein